MARTVGIGIQSFEKMIMNHCFYVDKTHFIKEWWENQDDVTLIARPRRFGKTLNMNMLDCFFSVKHKDQGCLFDHLFIGKEEKYRNLQGTFPVISLSFANIKETEFAKTKKRIGQLISELYLDHYFLLDSDQLLLPEKEMIQKNIQDPDPVIALNQLSRYLFKHYGKKVIILLDEYDTPLQEAYIYGYWQELTDFIRNLFNSTFKTNPCLERAVMTGITRVGKESIFSDLNNLEVVTTTSEKYEDCFGFTEEEVWEALRECGLYEERQKVKDWYDGFTFGRRQDIYNPWSILNFLDKKRISSYWANTSSNSLIDRLIRKGDRKMKMDMENLLQGGVLRTRIDEQIVFNQLDSRIDAVWSLFLACGYLKVKNYEEDELWGRVTYELVLTNREVYFMFNQMIENWFKGSVSEYNDFVKAMLAGDLKSMNVYMNKIAMATFSFFDSGNKPSESTEPERFYHAFVLGLLVDLSGRYVITSNRESGLGRYDVMLEPQNSEDAAIILEFKVREAESEKTLEDTAKEALAQIERQKYKASLEAKGIDAKRITSYGFAFEGKKILIGKQ